MLKNNEYDIEIRRINEDDINGGFQTGDNAFDETNPTGTLKEFFESEQRGFRVYVLRKMKDDTTVGVIRVRYDFDKINDELAKNYVKAPAMYFSRLATLEKKINLGVILREFFVYIAKEELLRLETDRLYIYLKCREETIPFFLKRMRLKIKHSYEDTLWGTSVLMVGQIRKRV